MGYQALAVSTTGYRNSCIGSHAGEDITTGKQNCALGHYALANCTTSDYNTAVGEQALRNLSTAINNDALGHAAGYDITTGNNNICVGTSSGRASSPSGAITTEQYRVCIGNNNITNAYIKVDWTVTSDRRDKTDIEPFKHGLSWINKLNPVTYRWDNRSDYANGIPDGSKKGSKLNIGLIAQDEIEVEKEHGYGDTSENMLVSHVNEDGNYGMQYSKLVPILINAVKELSAENTALKQRLDAAGL